VMLRLQTSRASLWDTSLRLAISLARLSRPPSRKLHSHHDVEAFELTLSTSSLVASGQKKVEEVAPAVSAKAEDASQQAAGLASAADKKTEGAISVRFVLCCSTCSSSALTCFFRRTRPAPPKASPRSCSTRPTRRPRERRSRSTRPPPTSTRSCRGLGDSQIFGRRSFGRQRARTSLAFPVVAFGSSLLFDTRFTSDVQK